MNNLRTDIEKCKTEKQLYGVLRKYGISVYKDDSAEVGCFSIWISETERIYKSCRSHYMTYQKWHITRFEYSGIPTFFG